MEHEHDLAVIKSYIRNEVNSALVKGGVYSAALGLLSSAIIGVLLLTGAAEDLLLPGILAFSAGCYSIIIYRMALGNKVEGRMMYALFLVFVSFPTFFFITSHFMLPAGAASYITGPISYLYFFLIVLTGFIFDFKLSVMSGVVSAAGYMLSYSLAYANLSKIIAPDKVMYQDFVTPPMYVFKCIMMIFTGLVVGVLSENVKKLILRILNGERDREMINKLFGQFVSNEVRERILGEKLGLLGERKEVVVLFSDVRGFSTYSERSDPDEIVERLNEYFDRMVNAVTKNGGVVDKFIGDAIMAVFGGVVDLPDPVNSAFNAARDMRSELAALNASWKARGKEPFENGIGMHFGEVLQGAIGSSERKDFTVIGDTVNIASRVEGMAKNYPFKVIVSEQFYRRLGEAQKKEFERIGAVKVKGREGEVELYGANL